MCFYVCVCVHIMKSSAYTIRVYVHYIFIKYPSVFSPVKINEALRYFFIENRAKILDFQIRNIDNQFIVNRKIQFNLILTRQIYAWG